MLNIINKIERVILSMAILTTTLLTSCNKTDTAVPAGKLSPITADGFLSSQNGKLTNKKGETVVLRGINLGGWLLQESWMCPINKGDKGFGNYDTIAVFEKRGFTESQILELFDTYQDNFITTKDLDNIASLGLNCVRVPFWYRNFQKDDKGTYYSADNLDQNPGFKRLDFIVNECQKRGIYVMLDLHGANGFQSDDHSSGKSHSSVFFNDDSAGKTARTLTAELWTTIAARYKDSPVVCAYDLLNEPMNGFGDKKDDKVLWNAYDELYKAIRKVDAAHVISVEGIWELSNLPDPKEYGWENMLYQTHNYNWKTSEIDAKIADVKLHSDWNVPVIVGEFQAAGIWDYTLSAYNNAGISWTTWTYKGAKSPLSDWFLYRNTGATLVDPDNDSFDVIKEKWSKVRTEDGYELDEALQEMLKKYSGGTVATDFMVGFVKFEAENIMNATIMNSDVSFVQDEHFSNGKATGELFTAAPTPDKGWTNIPYIAFTVDSPFAGTVTLKIAYTGNKGGGLLRLNGGENVKVTYTDAKELTTIEQNITVEKGANVLWVSGLLGSKSGINIDFVAVG